MKYTVRMEVNGASVQREIEARTLLVHFLREEIGLTGTNVGCETSLCGACTVLIDGKAVKSCTQLALQAEGASVTTIEGMATNGDLHPLQQAFWDHHGLQCGFCTPGMLMTAIDLIDKYPLETDQDIRKGLSGNLCRCTGYQNIVTSVREGAKQMRSP